MKTPRLFAICGLCAFALTSANAQTKPESMIPHLRKQGAATQLIVDGKPYLALAGELRNSTTSSEAYMKPIWPRMTAAHLNTVLAAVTWELMEPQEGKFDFTVVDNILKDARANNQRVGSPLVRQLEERQVHLPAALDENQPGSFPAYPKPARQEPADPDHLERRQPRRGQPRLCGSDETLAGSGRQQTHRPDDAGRK